jgi:multidrug efflux system membrane fusion protein
MTTSTHPGTPDPARPVVSGASPGDGSSPRGSGTWIVVLVLALAAGGGGWAYWRFGEHPAGTAVSAKPPARSMPVKTAIVRKGDLKLYLTGLGTVTPLNTVTLRSRVDGQIIKAAFTEGQLVKEGDLLIEIDPRPFEVLLSQAEAQQAKDQALLKNARIDLDRYQQAKNAVSAQQLATQEATVTQAEAAIRADQAQMENAKLQLVYSRIASPIPGRIGLRLVDSGNMVRANDATGLAVITQTRPISVVFSLPEESIRPLLATIRSGSDFPVEAYDRDLKSVLATGTLLALDNQVDPATGTIRIKAVFPNEKETLFPNQFVNARLQATILKDAVIVPTAALQRNPQSTIVYVVTVERPASSSTSAGAGSTGAAPAERPKGGKPKDEAPPVEGKIEIRSVITGPSEGEETVVESGLVPGEIVVTDGVEKLEKDTRVRVVVPAALERPAKGSP